MEGHSGTPPPGSSLPLPSARGQETSWGSRSTWAHCPPFHALVTWCGCLNTVWSKTGIKANVPPTCDCPFTCPHDRQRPCVILQVPARREGWETEGRRSNSNKNKGQHGLRAPSLPLCLPFCAQVAHDGPFR